MSQANETCFSCGITHDQVECKGMFYCPNALCMGSGGAWFRHKLHSYTENSNGTHSVDTREYLSKGREYNKEKNIKIDNFQRLKDLNEKMDKPE